MDKEEIAALVRENERLRDELKSYEPTRVDRVAVEGIDATGAKAVETVDVPRFEPSRLQAENERLRAALDEAATGLRTITRGVSAVHPKVIAANAQKASVKALKGIAND